METIILTLGWMGVFAPVALGVVGSTIGCSRAGMAACGAMLDAESGYGKFIGISAMPSTQAVLGIVVMFTLNREIAIVNAPGVFAVGLLTGIALMLSAIHQGNSVASAINASKNKPEIFGLSIAPAAIVEGFAVFVFVFALVVSGAIPQ
ncbi:MAG: ATP synthase subunit C [Pseudomonadales bacterium]|nr:ATP synthase subunit C [Pseudomonadales bacterium]